MNDEVSPEERHAQEVVHCPGCEIPRSDYCPGLKASDVCKRSHVDDVLREEWERQYRHVLSAIGVKAAEDGNEAIRSMVAEALWGGGTDGSVGSSSDTTGGSRSAGSLCSSTKPSGDVGDAASVGEHDSHTPVARLEILLADVRQACAKLIAERVRILAALGLLNEQEQWSQSDVLARIEALRAATGGPDPIEILRRYDRMLTLVDPTGKVHAYTTTMKGLADWLAAMVEEETKRGPLLASLGLSDEKGGP